MLKILYRIGTFFLDIFFPIKMVGKSVGGDYTARHAKHAGFLNLRNLNIQQKMSLVRSHSNVFYTLEYRQDLAKKMIWRFKYYLDKDALRSCTYILYDQLLADVSDRVGKLPFRVPHILIHYPSSTYFRGDKGFDHMKELLCLLDSFQSADNPFFTCCIHAVLPRQRKRQRQNTTSEVVSGAIFEIVSEFTSGTTSSATYRASEDEHIPQHLGTRRQRFDWSKKRFVLSPTFEKYMQEHAHTNSLVTRMSQTEHISPKTYIYCIDDVVTTGASMQAVSKMLEKEFDVQVMKFCICH